MTDLRSTAARLGARSHKMFGKYRGKVENNEDPLMLGRIQAKVAVLPGVLLNWCMPCTPYAGRQVGFYAIPPIGANVWIEFEGGDVNYPIWSGCFWGEGEVPVVTEEPPNPLVKTFATENIKLVLNDTPEAGGLTIRCNMPAVAVALSMTFDSTGITLSAPPCTIKMMTEEGITLSFPPDVIAMTEETIEVSVPASSLTMTGELVELESPSVSVTAEAAVAIEAGADFTVEAEGALNLTAGLEASVTAGATATIAADAELTIAGAMVMIN